MYGSYMQELRNVPSILKMSCICSTWRSSRYPTSHLDMQRQRLSVNRWILNSHIVSGRLVSQLEGLPGKLTILVWVGCQLRKVEILLLMLRIRCSNLRLMFQLEVGWKQVFWVLRTLSMSTCDKTPDSSELLYHQFFGMAYGANVIQQWDWKSK